MDIDKTINPLYKSYRNVQNLSSRFFQLKKTIVSIML